MTSNLHPTSRQSDESTQILLVDDHLVLLRGLRLLIERIPGMAVCGEATTSEEALKILKTRPVDMIMVDIFMPGNENLQFLQQLRQEKPDLAVMVLSQCTEGDVIEKVIDLGASGYILKSECFTEIELALAAINEGRTYFGPRIEEILNERSSLQEPRLSPRELEVAKLVSQGKTNKEIGKDLNCSEFTIKTHKANLMRKIGAHNAVEISNWVHKKGPSL